jgi:hypothetical protein
LFQSPQDSDVYLLGSTKPRQRADGNWDCPQPQVELLGLALFPVFVNGLARDPPTNTVTVTIVEARNLREGASFEPCKVVVVIVAKLLPVNSRLT